LVDNKLINIHTIPEEVIMKIINTRLLIAVLLAALVPAASFAMKRNNEEITKKVNKVVKKKKINKEKTNLICPYYDCKELRTSLTALSNHIINDHNSICPFCLKQKNILAYSLRKHLVTKHSDKTNTLTSTIKPIPKITDPEGFLLDNILATIDDEKTYNPSDISDPSIIKPIPIKAIYHTINSTGNGIGTINLGSSKSAFKAYTKLTKKNSPSNDEQKTYNSSEIFDEWIDEQKVFSHDSLTITDLNFQDWHKNRTQLPIEFKNQLSAFKLFLEKLDKKKLVELYECLDSNIEKLCTIFKERNFKDSSYTKKENNESIIARYNVFLEFLLDPNNLDSKNEFLLDSKCFTCANNVFNYCFRNETNSTFKTLLKSNNVIDRSFVHFCYATMFYYFVGQGWLNWHKNTLTKLKQQYDQGSEVVYIAGGPDIYQLLKEGVYKIRIIDPMLPSQEKFYSSGWKILVEGKISDTIDCEEEGIVLKRTNHQESGSFKVKLSTGETQDIPLSETIWTIYSRKNKKELGKITFDRRFAKREDLIVKPKKAYVMSFNCIHYVIKPTTDGGWPITHQTLNDKDLLYIKQLKDPIAKNTLKNIASVEKIGTFIGLSGSDTT